MKRLPTLIPLLALAAVGLGTAHAAGKVDVTTVRPEKFFDTGISTVARERNLKILTEFIEKLGRQLPEGQTLNVELLDVDLAGQVNPLSLHELRVMRGGMDWPKITLRYRLQDGSATLKSGEDKLVDINYLSNGQVGRYAGRELGYEMRMVQRWFDDTILTKKIADRTN